MTHLWPLFRSLNPLCLKLQICALLQYNRGTTWYFSHKRNSRILDDRSRPPPCSCPRVYWKLSYSLNQLAEVRNHPYQPIPCRIPIVGITGGMASKTPLGYGRTGYGKSSLWKVTRIPGAHSTSDGPATLARGLCGNPVFGGMWFIEHSHGWMDDPVLNQVWHIYPNEQALVSKTGCITGYAAAFSEGNWFIVENSRSLRDHRGWLVSTYGIVKSHESSISYQRPVPTYHQYMAIW